jgi:lysophospholipid acyltransferase (LPLAT)-like uncharacterized protein
MRIRHPLVIRVLGLVLACVVRLWIGTLRYRYHSLGINVHPHQRGLTERYIYAFWHENMLLLAYRFGRPDIRVLISQHADGQLITEVCRHLGFGTVRGSTTRGGAEAVRQMLKLGRGTHFAVTPDGPRGPRRRAQQGLVYLAAKTGLSIVPVGIGYHRPWRMRSWDRFALPRPWSLGICIAGEPVPVPADVARADLAEYMQRVEAALQRVSDLAERWAETGKWDAPRTTDGMGRPRKMGEELLIAVNGRRS